MTTYTPSDRKTTTVLIVEDDTAASALIRVNLEADGFRVAIARDGFVALAATATGNIDAVITDMVMPRMDGWALCDALRNQPETARMPIIGLTIAMPDRTTRLRADAIITKPYDYPVLRDVLERVLATRTYEENHE